MQALDDALGSLGIVAIDTVLADHPGRRRVVRAADLVVLAGPSSDEFAAMASAYGGPLGAHVVERLVAGAWPEWPHG